MSEVDEPICTVDNFQVGNPSVNVLSNEKRAGTLHEKKWLGREYDANTHIPVQYAQNVLALNGKSEEEIKDTWIEIEGICDDWRKRNNLEIRTDQRYMPVYPSFIDGVLYNRRLHVDSDLFWGIADPSFPKSDAISVEEARKLLEREGMKILFAITLLYENYIGHSHDAMLSFAKIIEIESTERKLKYFNKIEKQKRNKAWHKVIYNIFRSSGVVPNLNTIYRKLSELAEGGHPVIQEVRDTGNGRELWVKNTKKPIQEKTLQNVVSKIKKELSKL